MAGAPVEGLAFRAPYSRFTGDRQRRGMPASAGLSLAIAASGVI